MMLLHADIQIINFLPVMIFKWCMSCLWYIQMMYVLPVIYSNDVYPACDISKWYMSCLWYIQIMYVLPVIYSNDVCPACDIFKWCISCLWYIQMIYVLPVIYPNDTFRAYDIFARNTVNMIVLCGLSVVECTELTDLVFPPEHSSFLRSKRQINKCI